jgi:hypothetical protein
MRIRVYTKKPSGIFPFTHLKSINISNSVNKNFDKRIYLGTFAIIIMPTVEIIDGIKITIHGRAHWPPHIHVLYNEFEVVIEIVSGKILAGDLPVRQKAKVREWLITNHQWALEFFNELNQELQ